MTRLTQTKSKGKSMTRSKKAKCETNHMLTCQYSNRAQQNRIFALKGLFLLAIAAACCIAPCYVVGSYACLTPQLATCQNGCTNFFGSQYEYCDWVDDVRGKAGYTSCTTSTTPCTKTTQVGQCVGGQCVNPGPGVDSPAGSTFKAVVSGDCTSAG